MNKLFDKRSKMDNSKWKQEVAKQQAEDKLAITSSRNNHNKNVGDTGQEIYQNRQLYDIGKQKQDSFITDRAKNYKDKLDMILDLQSQYKKRNNLIYQDKQNQQYLNAIKRSGNNNEDEYIKKLFESSASLSAEETRNIIYEQFRRFNFSVDESQEIVDGMDDLTVYLLNLFWKDFLEVLKGMGRKPTTAILLGVIRNFVRSKYDELDDETRSTLSSLSIGSTISAGVSDISSLTDTIYGDEDGPSTIGSLTSNRSTRPSTINSLTADSATNRSSRPTSLASSPSLQNVYEQSSVVSGRNELFNKNNNDNDNDDNDNDNDNASSINSGMSIEQIKANYEQMKSIMLDELASAQNAYLEEELKFYKQDKIKWRDFKELLSVIDEDYQGLNTYKSNKADLIKELILISSIKGKPEQYNVAELGSQDAVALKQNYDKLLNEKALSNSTPFDIKSIIFDLLKGANPDEIDNTIAELRSMDRQFTAKNNDIRNYRKQNAIRLAVFLLAKKRTYEDPALASQKNPIQGKGKLIKGKGLVMVKHNVDLNKLNKNILAVRYENNSHAYKVKPVSISDECRQLILKLAMTGHIDYELFDPLSMKEKRLVEFFIHRNKIKDIELERQGMNDLIERFEVVKGQLNSGNNNPKLREDICEIADEMYYFDIINKKQYDNILNTYKD